MSTGIDFYSGSCYNHYMNKTKTTQTIGNKTYFLPYRANHCWVEDAKGNNVAEAYDETIAKALASMLNLRADVENALVK